MLKFDRVFAVVIWRQHSNGSGIRNVGFYHISGAPAQATKVKPTRCPEEENISIANWHGRLPPSPTPTPSTTTPTPLLPPTAAVVIAAAAAALPCLPLLQTFGSDDGQSNKHMWNLHHSFKQWSWIKMKCGKVIKRYYLFLNVGPCKAQAFIICTRTAKDLASHHGWLVSSIWPSVFLFLLCIIRKKTKRKILMLSMTVVSGSPFFFFNIYIFPCSF